MKYLAAILLVLFSLTASAQWNRNDTTKYVWYKYQYGTRMARAMYDSVFAPPIDTAFSKTGLATKGNTLYVGNGSYWTAAAGSGSATPDTINLHWPLYAVGKDHYTSIPYFDSLYGRLNALINVSFLELEGDTLLTGFATYKYGGVRDTASPKDFKIDTALPGESRVDMVVVNAPSNTLDTIKGVPDSFNAVAQILPDTCILVAYVNVFGSDSLNYVASPTTLAPTGVVYVGETGQNKSDPQRIRFIENSGFLVIPGAGGLSLNGGTTGMTSSGTSGARYFATNGNNTPGVYDPAKSHSFFLNNNLVAKLGNTGTGASTLYARLYGKIINYEAPVGADSDSALMVNASTGVYERRKINGGGGSGWGLTGNSVSPTTQFLGSTNDSNIVFKRNGDYAGLIGKTNTAFGAFAAKGQIINDPTEIDMIGNVSIGYFASGNSIQGSDNVAIGFSAHLNGAGNNNVAIGSGANGNQSGGNSNVSIGYSAAQDNVGDNNIAIGEGSMVGNFDGDNNITIGYFSNVGSSALNNAIAIGAGSTVGASNSMSIGDTAIGMNVGIGTAYPSSTLDVRGTVTIKDGTQGAGKILTSDANGAATWETPSGGGGNLQSVTDVGNATTNNIEINKANGDIFLSSSSSRLLLTIDNSIGSNAALYTDNTDSSAVLQVHGVGATESRLTANNSSTSLYLNAPNDEMASYIIQDSERLKIQAIVGAIFGGGSGELRFPTYSELNGNDYEWNLPLRTGFLSNAISINGAEYVADSSGLIDLGTISGGSVKQNDTANVTVSNTTTWFISNPAVVKTSQTITMPASPTDGQTVSFNFGGTINAASSTVVNTLTFTPNTGQGIVGQNVFYSVEADDVIIFRYNSTNSKWYRQ